MTGCYDEKLSPDVSRYRQISPCRQAPLSNRDLARDANRLVRLSGRGGWTGKGG